MPYMECPSCGLGLNGARALLVESCPRCLGKGETVALEMKLGRIRGGLFTGTPASERITPADKTPRLAGP